MSPSDIFAWNMCWQNFIYNYVGYCDLRSENWKIRSDLLTHSCLIIPYQYKILRVVTLEGMVFNQKLTLSLILVRSGLGNQASHQATFENEDRTALEKYLRTRSNRKNTTICNTMPSAVKRLSFALLMQQFAQVAMFDPVQLHSSMYL